MATDGGESPILSNEIFVGVNGITEDVPLDESSGEYLDVTSVPTINLEPAALSGMTHDDAYAILVDSVETGSLASEQDEDSARKSEAFMTLAETLLQNVRILYDDHGKTKHWAQCAFADFQSLGFKNFNPRHLYELAEGSFNARWTYGSEPHVLRLKRADCPSGSLEFTQIFDVLTHMVTNLERGDSPEMTSEMCERMEAFVQELMTQCHAVLSLNVTNDAERRDLLQQGAQVIADIRTLKRKLMLTEAAENPKTDA
ncbi:MAG TPA: hypothetical protein VJB82_00470 [Candidatus Peribacterales bacterium]|nr:hypothetical protein [Candidatus Peribacterales bacterium]